jgi:hypothetical protein
VVPRPPLCESWWASILSRGAPACGSRVAWVCAAVLLLGAALAGTTVSTATSEEAGRKPPSATAGREAPPQGNLRVREGTEIVDQSGQFRTIGDRVIFFTADGKRRFVGLENLSLERIAQTIAESPQTLHWDVTGTVTEYRGANFLLVRRAILKTGMQPPAADF